MDNGQWTMNRITNPEPVEGQQQTNQQQTTNNKPQTTNNKQQTTNIHPELVEGKPFFQHPLPYTLHPIILSLSKKKNPSNPLIRGKTINNKQNYES